LQKAGSSDRWMWMVVLGATALVVGLAVLKGENRAGGSGAAGAVAAPRVSLPLLDGKGSASPQPGKVTVVDFWATWCGPCKVSMPRVQQLYTEYKPRGVDLYSVDTDEPGPDREPQVREFLLQRGLTFPVVVDDEAKSGSAAFAVESLPTMFLLDKGGKIVWTHVGALTSAHDTELRQAIDSALAQN
jgi:thiol-disulfide isomerase/thioredoxin